MIGTPIEGESYVVIEGPRSHRGLVGVASNISPMGIGCLLTLSNLKEWGARGIDTSIQVMSTEVMPAPKAEEQRPVAPSLNLSTGTGKHIQVPVSRLSTRVDPSLLPYQGSEGDLVAECLLWLKDNGFESAVVGQDQAKGSGTTVGYPDLSFRRAGWLRGLWVLVELKTATGTLTPEQEALWERGGSHVVRSAADLAQLARLYDALCTPLRHLMQYI